ncbi:MAG: hypothetical protein O3C40_02570 [Planctomycetota bacterium]|nr:hypothetical protein [Planctomycetota bacterium]
MKLGQIRLSLTAVPRRLTMELLKVAWEFMFEMITRRCISFVMTALVLGCPLQCAECCGMCWNQAYADSDSPACGNDADCDCKPDGQLPCDHDGGSSKEADCFCNGAVLSDGAKCPDLDVNRGFFAVVMNGTVARQLAGTSSGNPALRGGSHFPPLVSGRDICTLVNSYLL